MSTEKPRRGGAEAFPELPVKGVALSEVLRPRAPEHTLMGLSRQQRMAQRMLTMNKGSCSQIQSAPQINLLVPRQELDHRTCCTGQQTCNFTLQVRARAMMLRRSLYQLPHPCLKSVVVEQPLGQRDRPRARRALRSDQSFARRAAIDLLALVEVPSQSAVARGLMPMS